MLCACEAGNCSLTEISYYLSVGFTAVIPKPFSVEDLREAMRVHVLADGSAS